MIVVLAYRQGYSSRSSYRTGVDIPLPVGK